MASSENPKTQPGARYRSAGELLQELVLRTGIRLPAEPVGKTYTSERLGGGCVLINLGPALGLKKG
jgi:hypothetical protein